MRNILLQFILVILAVGCQEDQLVKKKALITDSAISAASVSCAVGDEFDIELDGFVVGRVSIAGTSPHDNMLSFGIEFYGEHLLVGSAISAGNCGHPMPVSFEYRVIGIEERFHGFIVYLPEEPQCGCLIVDANVGVYNSYTSAIDSTELQYVIEYCKCAPGPTELKTMTQELWKANPYLPAYMDAFAGSVVQVGCENTIKLTSAEAIKAFLPSYGTPAALNADFTDPGQSLQNSLAGEVVALAMTIAVDTFDDYFAPLESYLRNAIVASGTFAGWTVEEVLDEAEKVLGGCDSQYSAAEMNEVVAAINKSFENGTSQTGFLLIP